MNTFRYRLLDRMKEDCKYFLGSGNRQEKYLWAKDAFRHIEYMKFLWGSFSEDAKPEWLTMEDIEQFEKEMLPDGSDRSMVQVDDYGSCFCGNCKTQIVCDDCGDMPLTCPQCGRNLDWFVFKEVYFNER